MRVRKTAAALVVLLIGGVALSIIGPLVFPPSYYFDTVTVLENIVAPYDDGSTDSFAHTALLYRLLGFGSLWPHALAGPFSFLVVFAALCWSAQLVRARWHPWLMLLLAAWTVPLAVFDGTYSKEMVALLVVAAVAALCKSARGAIVAGLVVLAYAYFYRTYWAIVLALWVTLLACGRLRVPWVLRLAIAIVAIGVMSYVAHDHLDIYLSDGRTITTEGREGDPYQVTIITNPYVNVSVATDVANTVLCWLGLIMPVYLLSLGGLQHLGFAAFQFLNTALFVVIQVRLAGRRDWAILGASSFCVAYSLVQGMFEPDFGSFVKHETNLLPVYFYLLRELAEGVQRKRSAAPERTAVAAR